MEALLNIHISWIQFGLLLIIAVFFYALINRFKNFFKYITGFETLHIPNAIIIGVVILDFILISPLINGIIVFTISIFFFPLISSYVKGIFISHNAQINEGDLIKIGENKGVIDSINFSGVKLLTDSNNIFIPYNRISQSIIEKYQSDQTRFVSFLCQPIEEDRKLSIQDVQKVIFDFPFLEAGAKIGVEQDIEGFIINITLSNDRFRTSLVRNMEKAGIKLTQLTKIE